MGKKYYLRGLGLGIVVTAVIMGIALRGGGKRELTDDEVIARAKALGMTENTSLLEPAEDDEGLTGQEPAAEEPAEENVKKDVAAAKPKTEEEKRQPEGETRQKTDEEQQPEEKPKDSAESKPQEKPAANTNEMTKQDEDTGQEKPTETKLSQQKTAVSLTIVSGDGSYTVAKKLEEAGVISSASAYDDFLCQNGYDKRLRAGTFQIPTDANEEQIARIVTGQQ